MSAESSLPLPNGPQDLDLVALILAPLPPEVAQAYIKAHLPPDHFTPEEGHTCPGGFGE